MALQGSGPIKLSEVQTEFGGTNPISLSEYYAAEGSLPTTGAISIGDFYGLSDGIIVTFDLYGGGGAGGGGAAGSPLGGVEGGGGGAGARVTAINASGEIVNGQTYTFEIGMGGARSEYGGIGGNGRDTSIIDIGSGVAAIGGGGGGGSNEQYDALFTSPGSYLWRVPAGVTSIQAICVGGGGGGGGTINNDHSAGGGGGGACRWRNNISVTPGQHLRVVVGAGGSAGASSTTAANRHGGDGGQSKIETLDSSTLYLAANGGGGGRGANSGTGSGEGAGGVGPTQFNGDGTGGLDQGGGDGGNGGAPQNNSGGGGGGGAGGYLTGKNGGNGATSNNNTGGTGGLGGGGGGGGTSNTAAGGGGGVGLYGSTGSSADNGAAGGSGSGGGGGSDGANGSNGSNGGGAGGQFGGGGGSSGDDDSNRPGAAGGGGGVRIIFGQPNAGSTIEFPNTNVLGPTNTDGWDVNITTQDNGQDGGCGGGGSWSNNLDGASGSNHAGAGGSALSLTPPASGYTYTDKDGFAGRSGALSVGVGSGGGGIGGAATGSTGNGGLGTSFTKAGYSYTNVARGGYAGGASSPPTQTSFGCGGHGAGNSTSYADDGNNGAIVFEYPSSVGYAQIRCYSTTVYTAVSGNDREYVVYPTPGNVGVPQYDSNYTIEKEVVKIAWDKDPDSLPIWATVDDSYQAITGVSERTDPLSANLLTAFTNNEVNSLDPGDLMRTVNGTYGGGFVRDYTGNAPSTTNSSTVAPYYGSLGEHNSRTAITMINLSTALELASGTSCTIEAWIKVDQWDKDPASSTEQIFSYGENVSSFGASGWGVTVISDTNDENGHIVVTTQESASSAAAFTHFRQDDWYGADTGIDPQPIKTNTWFHLCVEINDVDMSVYVNGILQGSLSLAVANYHQVGDRFVIFGRRVSSGGGSTTAPNFIGQVMDFRIYDTIKYGAEFFVPIGHGLPI